MSHRIIFILFLSINCLLATAQEASNVSATDAPKDTLFRSVAVGVDAVGIGQKIFSDYGQYEAAVRVSLYDKFFPVIEVGIGKADHDDEVTSVRYKCSAPYFRIGCDYNLLKDKHADYKVFGGLRYAFTSFTADILRPGMTDPVWGGEFDYDATGTKCTQHWAEAVVGLDAKIWGPFHLGWSVRYRQRLAFDVGDIGNVWYVPGYGKSDTSTWGATFNVTIQL